MKVKNYSKVSEIPDGAFGCVGNHIYFRTFGPDIYMKSNENFMTNSEMNFFVEIQTDFRHFHPVAFMGEFEHLCH